MRYPRWFWVFSERRGSSGPQVFFVIPVYTILAIAMGEADPIFLDPNPT